MTQKATVPTHGMSDSDPLDPLNRIVTETNKHLLTAEELREWNDTVDEYHRRVESGDVI